MKKLFEDENHTTVFDFSAAKEVFEPHTLASYHSEYISDVDFVLESEDELLFMEYKNGNTKVVNNPQAFVDKVKSGSLANVLIKKFYGTLLLVMITDRNPMKKPVRYICVIEAGDGIDDVMMKKLRNKVYAGLPFEYQSMQEIKVPVLDGFDLINLARWNNVYTQYPIKVKETTESISEQ